MNIQRTPQPMDILLYSAESLVDVLVRMGTLSSFDHVAIALSDTEMIEALPGGVVVSPIRQNPVICRYDIQDTSKIPQYVETIKQYVGYQYGFIADAFAAIGMNYEAPHQIECAQLAIHAITMMGFTAPKIPTPQHIFNSALDNGAVAFRPS